MKPILSAARDMLLFPQNVKDSDESCCEEEHGRGLLARMLCPSSLLHLRNQRPVLAEGCQTAAAKQGLK